jgi:hypothetical protein
MLGPVHAQVSRRVKVSVSDRGFPALTDRSGTQRARRLRSRTTVGAPAPWSSSPPSELRITSVFSCVARRFKARASFRFVACCWRRPLAVDGGSGASQGHASTGDLAAFKTITVERSVVVLTWADDLSRMARTWDRPAHIPRSSGSTSTDPLMPRSVSARRLGARQRDVGPRQRGRSVLARHGRAVQPVSSGPPSSPREPG